MQYAEDNEKGLMAIKLDDDNILKFARCQYDGKLQCFRPAAAGITMSQYVTGLKKDMVKTAKRLGFPAANVEKIGNRFGVVYGIRHDPRDTYFLAIYA